MSTATQNKIIDLNHTRLFDITTPLQASRGNKAFICQKTGCIYTSYASGAVRRSKVYDKQYLKNGSSNVIKHLFNRYSYQLNKHFMTKNENTRYKMVLHYADLHASKYNSNVLI